MKRIFFCVLLSALVFTGLSQVSDTVRIRYDGVYQGFYLNPDNEEMNTYYFLRFYQDGTVLDVLSLGNALQIAEWFNKENYTQPYQSVGKYEIKGKNINFTTTCILESVEYSEEYKGIIVNENQIDFKIKSLFNGYECEKKYFFIADGDSTTDASKEYINSIYLNTIDDNEQFFNAFPVDSLKEDVGDCKILLDSAMVLIYGGDLRLIPEDQRITEYENIVRILKKVIELQPDHAEARYFLGYTYSKMNSGDANGMINMNLELVKKSSEQFEYVNKITPNYTGVKLVLDPYSKLSSEWGSMAMCYLHDNKSDSAIWAFKEGKKRGGFGNYILELNKKILDACSKNSILVSVGDNFTIPLCYLQVVEGYRKDVAVVDINLLNTTWYPAYLNENKIVGFDMPKAILDTIEYSKWADTSITINNFSWIVKPTYHDQYILRGDILFLSLLKQTKFQRDLYFTIGFPEEMKLSLKEYLTDFIIVEKFIHSEKLVQSENDYEKSITELLQLSQKLNLNSSDEIEIYDYFRYNLLRKINNCIENNDKNRARELMELLDKFAEENKIPYSETEGKEWADYLRQQL